MGPAHHRVCPLQIRHWPDLPAPTKHSTSCERDLSRGPVKCQPPRLDQQDCHQKRNGRSIAKRSCPRHEWQAGQSWKDVKPSQPGDRRDEQPHPESDCEGHQKQADTQDHQPARPDLDQRPIRCLLHDTDCDLPFGKCALRKALVPCPGRQGRRQLFPPSTPSRSCSTRSPLGGASVTGPSGIAPSGGGPSYTGMASPVSGSMKTPS